MAGRDLQTVLDVVMDGVVVLDGQGHVELVNEQASRILEVSAASALGQPSEALLGPNHMLNRLAAGVRGSGRASIESGRLLERRLMDDLIVDLAASPILDRDGRVDGVVVALRDRTIQHGLEQEQNERDQLKAFGRFASGIAHEVKNPLAGIRGMAELLASRAADAKTKDAAQLIVREAGRIASLVDDLMVFTHGESLRFAEVNIHRVLDDVVELVSVEGAPSGVRIERRYDPSIPPFAADADRLVQVFLNLARNALQAVSQEGKIAIETRMTLHHRLTLPNGRSVPTLMATVEDNGSGIAADLLEKVATPLFTTRAAGTGLGLAVAQHWVTRHDGTLRIESEPGKGTRVRVALPLRSPPGATDASSGGGRKL